MTISRDPIFRACTRPAMFAGVPMLPFLLVTGIFLIAAGWTAYLVSGYVALFLVVAYFPILVAMRAVTKKDDQRLRQLLMRARMRFGQRASIAQWSAASYAALRYTRRQG